MAPPMSKPFLVIMVLQLSLGCSDTEDTGIDPTEVKFGDTALVVVVNPVVNDANLDSVPAPGNVRDGVTVRSDDGISDISDEKGIAVLAPLTPGMRTITVTGGGLNGGFTVTLTDGALREVAIAAEATRADIMVNLDYKSDQIVELVPSMTNAQVNDALKPSDRVVFLKGGVYAGDLDFSGSRVTLFGEGLLGGAVTVQGNITISGSDSRIRGTHVTGNVVIPASGTGMSFSQVDGTLDAEGSDTTLLANALCGPETVTGSGSIVVGNAGTAPVTGCP